MRLQHLAVSLVGTWLAAMCASADVVRFHNGTKFRGKVLTRTDTEVVLELDGLGRVSFAPGEIASIEPEPDQPQPQAAAAPATPPPVSAPPLSPSAPERTTVQRPRTTQEVLRAVALIGTVFQDGRYGFGSGVVVTPKGLIVTNRHVVWPAKTVDVILPDEEGKIAVDKAQPRRATVLKTHRCLDLALVRVPVRTPDYLPMAEDHGVLVGAPVRAVGNPQGLTVSISKGVISSVRTFEDTLGKKLLGLFQSVPGCDATSTRVIGKYTMIQTDAAINPGNSGGPLLNDQSEIVGINTFIVSGSEGLGFAIHAKHVRDFVGSYASE
jgi:S1-C subfamily serine protease